MKKIILITLLTISLIFIFIISKINKENLSFVSKYKETYVEKILSKNKSLIICIVSSECPGKYETTPLLIDNIIKFKKLNIPYIIIADELFNEKIDSKLDNFKNEFNFKNEEIYILDKGKYPKNGGVLNGKGRYKAFINDLCNLCSNNFIFGYTNYVLVKDGEYIMQSPDITSKELNLLKN